MSGNLALGLLILSLLYMVFLNGLFYTKKHISTKETKFFGFMLVANLCGLVMEILCILTINFLGIDNIFTIVVNKIFLLYHLYFTFIIALYAILVIFNENIELPKEKLITKISLIFFAITCIVVLALPIELYSDVKGCYSGGLSVSAVYDIVGFETLIIIFLFIKNYKVAIKNKKKLIPLIIYLIGAIIVSIIQRNNPYLTLSTEMETFLVFLMYNTIENPDVKMIQELQVAREQAEKANSAKTDFLSSMSHEIRTPLNAIVGFSDCIMEAKDLGEAKENARDIVNASKTLLDIVNGILDISKIEAGKIEIVNSKYDAHETFEELAKLITPKMNEKGLDFTYNIAPDLPHVLYGDHANVKKVVTNLLSNACKYTEKGYVHYEVNCVNSKNVSKLIISVEDSGRGIKKDSVDKMFTKFQRLEEDRNTTIEGTGLGLAITKQLIELMGGRIIVHTVYGEGSKFTVVINQRIEAPDSLEKNTKKVSSTLDLKDLRIMLVDDTPLNLKVAGKLLERYNANHVISVSSGFECIERIQRGEKYDLILLDDMMPKMSGVETLKKLKQIEGFNIPTIALTANAISGMREKYLADGFDDYLAKPIEKEQLIQVVNQILGRSATEEINIPDYLKNPDINSPAIRDNIIAVGDNVSVIETPKMEIIPVEDNIEELLGNKLERNYKEPVIEVFKIHEAGKDTFDSSPYQRNKEELEVLDDSVKETSVEEIPHIDVVPLVGVDNNTLGDLGKCDRKYLENNGVDVEHGLELLGDMDMYNMTINDFMAEVEAKWARIVDYKEKNDMPNYAIEVHSLKSDCKYLGFMDLADIAYQHELKSKENDSEFVNNNFNELETKYKKVLDIAKNYVKDNPVSE